MPRQISQAKRFEIIVGERRYFAETFEEMGSLSAAIHSGKNHLPLPPKYEEIVKLGEEIILLAKALKEY